MTTLMYQEYMIFFFLFFTILTSWKFFFKNNFFVLNQNLYKTNTTASFNVFKKPQTINFLNWSMFVFFILLLLVFSINFNEFDFFWGHFKFTNTTFYFFQIIFLLNFFFFFLLKYIPKHNYNLNIEYYFILLNLVFFFALFFFVCTVYTFFFLLELTSSLVFYKFVISDDKEKVINSLKTNLNFLNTNNKSNFFLNMIFFQYWVMFFSSSLLLYSICTLFYVFGSTNFFLLDYLIFFNKTTPILNYFTLYTIGVSFFIGFILKVGFTPFHLFKIEIYKALPFISIFFYTIYFFSVFFLFLILFMLNVFNNFVNSIWFFFFLIILFGGLYMLLLLFDISIIKSFFAYSTIINTYSLVLITLSII